jgi:hypothetical protein
VTLLLTLVMGLVQRGTAESLSLKILDEIGL